MASCTACLSGIEVRYGLCGACIASATTKRQCAKCQTANPFPARNGAICGRCLLEHRKRQLTTPAPDSKQIASRGVSSEVSYPIKRLVGAVPDDQTIGGSGGHQGRDELTGSTLDASVWVTWALEYLTPHAPKHKHADFIKSGTRLKAKQFQNSAAYSNQMATLKLFLSVALADPRLQAMLAIYRPGRWNELSYRLRSAKFWIRAAPLFGLGVNFLDMRQSTRKKLRHDSLRRCAIELEHALLLEISESFYQHHKLKTIKGGVAIAFQIGAAAFGATGSEWLLARLGIELSAEVTKAAVSGVNSVLSYLLSKATVQAGKVLAKHKDDKPIGLLPLDEPSILDNIKAWVGSSPSFSRVEFKTARDYRAFTAWLSPRIEYNKEVYRTLWSGIAKGGGRWLSFEQFYKDMCMFEDIRLALRWWFRSWPYCDQFLEHLSADDTQDIQDLRDWIFPNLETCDVLRLLVASEDLIPKAGYSMPHRASDISSEVRTVQATILQSYAEQVLGLTLEQIVLSRLPSATTSSSARPNPCVPQKYVLGLRVTNVTRGGAAARAGIAINDTIIKVTPWYLFGSSGGHTPSLEAFRFAVSFSVFTGKEGKITIGVLRDGTKDGKVHRITVTVPWDKIDGDLVSPSPADEPTWKGTDLPAIGDALGIDIENAIWPSGNDHDPSGVFIRGRKAAIRGPTPTAFNAVLEEGNIVIVRLCGYATPCPHSFLYVLVERLLLAGDEAFANYVTVTNPKTLRLLQIPASYVKRLRSLLDSTAVRSALDPIATPITSLSDIKKSESPIEDEKHPLSRSFAITRQNSAGRDIFNYTPRKIASPGPSADDKIATTPPTWLTKAAAFRYESRSEIAVPLRVEPPPLERSRSTSKLATKTADTATSKTDDRPPRLTGSRSNSRLDDDGVVYNLDDSTSRSRSKDVDAE